MPSGLSRLRIHQLGAYGALLGYQKSSSAVFLDMLVVRRLVSFEFPSTLYRICSGIYRRDKILTRVRTPGTHHGPTQRFSAHDELVGVVGVLPTGHKVISEPSVYSVDMDKEQSDCSL